MRTKGSFFLLGAKDLALMVVAITGLALLLVYANEALGRAGGDRPPDGQESSLVEPTDNENEADTTPAPKERADAQLTPLETIDVPSDRQTPSSSDKTKTRPQPKKYDHRADRHQHDHHKSNDNRDQQSRRHRGNNRPDYRRYNAHHMFRGLGF